MESSWTTLTICVALWMLAFAAQVADYATARFDQLRLARGIRSRARLHAVGWVVPAGAVLIVALTITAQLSAQLLLASPANVAAAVLLALISVVLLVTVGSIIAVVVVRPPIDSYRLIRDELIERAGLRLHQDQVDDFRERMLAVDLLTRERVSPDSGTLSSALSLSVRTPYRLIAPVLAIVVVATVAGEVLVGRATVSALVLSAFIVASTAVLGIMAARASIALRAAVRSTQEMYRRELSSLLAEAERSSKKPVAGLGDRVARALSILREQQEPE